MRHFFSAVALMLLITACSGSEKEKEAKLPGQRIAVMTHTSSLAVDNSLGSQDVTLPDPDSNTDWAQDGGNLTSAPKHVAFSATLKLQSKSAAGGGAAWEDGALVTTPVIADGKLFSMDSQGVVSAVEAADLGRRLWISDAAVKKDQPEVLGGGLAYADGTVYATTGYGRVAAISAVDGKERWHVSVGTPVRSAPRIADGKVFMVTVDNQLLALNAADGKLVWNHRGINENAGFLGSVTPPIDKGRIIAPYSSGQLFSLNADNGEEAWSDTLLLPRRTSATGGFSGIGGNPVVAGGVVFAVSQGGLMAANDLSNGRRLWDIELSSGETPWVAGDFIFVLTSDRQLAALTARDGRIKWLQALPAFADEAKKEDPLRWAGPVLAGGQLWVVGAHGKLLEIAPKDGQVVKTHEIVQGVMTAPIVAGGTMYLVTKDAAIYAYK